MNGVIDFYFDFLLLYGYFVSMCVEEFVQWYNWVMVWYLILLGVVFKMIGGFLLFQVLFKGDYVWCDFECMVCFNGIEYCKLMYFLLFM